MQFFPTVDEDVQYFRSEGYTGSINDMHYAALGDLGYSGALTDRLRAYLLGEFGSYYEAMRDLRNGTSVFALLSYKVLDFDPALVLDFDATYYRTDGTTTDLVSAATHTRASSATYVDASGILQTAGVNVPRVGHHIWNGSAWVDEGYFHESESRVQLLHTTNALVTQSKIVMAVPHTLHFTGTGTVALSGASTAGPLVGTGTGEENRVSLTFTPTAGTLTITPSGDVSDAQLEVGSTPSSYIPNLAASGEVTRAADAMTIPAANLPWPEPEYIGPELVTNGTFDTDTSWTKTGATAIAAGVATLDGTSGTGLLFQDILTLGETYFCSFTISAITGTLFVIDNDGTVLASYTTTGTKTLSWTHGIASGNFIFRVSTGSNTATIDNVSVKEINPLAVSIQMEGRQTGDSSTFLRWYDDANNYITVGSGASDYVFTQAASGTVDSVTGGSFTGGVMQPYNVASTHASTFVAAAVDGVALTDNTTPIALADLSANDVQVGFDFNGTIKLLRAWSENLTEPGREEASA